MYEVERLDGWVGERGIAMARIQVGFKFLRRAVEATQSAQNCQNERRASVRVCVIDAPDWREIEMGSGVRHFGSRGVSADLQRRPWRLARRQKAKNSKAGLVPGGSSIKVNQGQSRAINDPWD